jgi:hypothetical protein
MCAWGMQPFSRTDTALSAAIPKDKRGGEAFTCLRDLSTPFNELNRFGHVAVLLLGVSHSDDIASLKPG